MIFKAIKKNIYFKKEWRISRSSLNFRESLFIHLIDDDGIDGWGEAVPVSRYNESTATALKAFEYIKNNIDLDSEKYFSDSQKLLHSFSGDYALKAAIDMALLDIFGKRYNLPVYKLFGLNRNVDISTSYTIGISNKEEIKEKIEESVNFNILKVKLGSENDYEMIDTIRKYTDKPLRIDVNEGWSRKEAIEKVKWLMDKNIELIEQPIKSADLEGIKALKEETGMIFIADEAVKRSEDILKIHEHYDGINIKLVKCGGLCEAFGMIHIAKLFNMKIMIGCMLETSLGITAASHLTPLIDYADLDSTFLIKNDLFKGVKFDNDKIIVPHEPGLGVKPHEEI